MVEMVWDGPMLDDRRSMVEMVWMVRCLSEQDDAFNSFQHCGEFSMLTQSSAAITAQVSHRMVYGLPALSAADPAAAVSPHTSQKHNIEHAMNGMAI